MQNFPCVVLLGARQVKNQHYLKELPEENQSSLNSPREFLK